MAEEYDSVEQVLAESSWLSEIPGIYDLIVQLVTANTPVDSILAQVRSSDSYKERFKGMALRAGAGYSPISEYEYLAVEDSYKGMLRNTGLLSTLASTDGEYRDLASRWIGMDVSAAEFSRRIDEGYAAVTDRGPAVRQAFNDFYGFTPDDSSLLLYFLDPQRGTQEIENQVAAVLVGGAAYEYGLNLTRARAEMWAERGVTGDIARQGFADISREAPLIDKLARIHQITPLAQQDLEEFFFHEDQGIAQKRTRLFQEALSKFQEGSFGSGMSSITNRRGGLTELVDIRRTY